MTPVSRRTFLAAGAGLVLATACGSDRRSSGSTTTAAGSGGASGDTVLVRFFNDGVQAAGLPQRFPFGLGDADGVLTTGGPDELAFTIVDDKGTLVTELAVPRHAEGLPRPYWPLQLQLTEPGIYTANVGVDGSQASSAFTVRPASEVSIPKPGDRMVPVETPTVDDSRGVTPICTRQPACPLHTQTLTAALATGKPVAALIGTPAYCQTGTCGPVLDVLLGLQSSHPDVQMVHAEIYVDPEAALSTGNTTAQGADLGAFTEAVQAYQLPFEPVLYLARAGGVIDSRLDVIFDATEVSAALARLS